MLSKLRLFILLVFICNSAYALQLKEAMDGSEIHANISAADLNRIRLKNDRIISAKVNLGDVNIDYEKTTGDIYVRLAKPRYKTTVNLFLISERGFTYKLLLTSKFIPSAQIILHNTEIVAPITKAKKSDGFKQQIVRLYKAMSTDQNLDGYKIEYQNKKKFLHKSLRAKLVTTYSSAEFTGYVYEVKNRKKAELFLKEQQFFTPGVLAIKLDSFLLEKGEGTKIFIIKG